MSQQVCAGTDIKAGLGAPATGLPYIDFYTMGVQPIKSYDEFKQVTGTDKIIVIDFWATWCGPCKMIGPIFEKIAETPAGEKLGFYKVDVDEQSQIASERFATPMDRAPYPWPRHCNCMRAYHTTPTM